MRHRVSYLAPFGFALAAVISPSYGGSPAEDDRIIFFEQKVRPILANHCYACHSADTKPAGGLRVDDRNGVLTGGDTGPAVVPGDPDSSPLLQRLKHADKKKRMPKEGAELDDEEVAALTRWIQEGANWTAVKVPDSLGRPKEWYEPLRKEHWAWQPLKTPAVPTVQDSSWPSDEVDRFILAGLETRGLGPVADADKATLLRRVTFDLTGLPPTPEELDHFLADESPDAFARTVDRLLASPRFGERWGRHWLDVARYGESTGPSRNIPYPHAWKYRDYVIDAVNNDVPYDRFITEQIAGDLLPAERPEDRDRLLTATGFLALGVKDVNQRFKVRFIMDNVDEQIDAVGRSVLALTVSCARCHDHKFDPIPQTDYYALAGIFTSTENAAGVRNKMGGAGLDYYDSAMLVKLTSNLPVPEPERVKELETKVAEAKAAWDAIRGTPEGLAKGPNGVPKQRTLRNEYDKFKEELLELTDPAARGFAVHGVREAKAIRDTEVRIRGEAEKLGPTVARGFLTAFDVPESPAVNREQSGRLELARWLTSPKNPVTPRVVVNRVWQHLFEHGIVATVDNFGTTGDTPSNPELLDHLANRFIHEGWSIKRLVRTLVLSRTYRLSSEASSAQLAADPANHLFWRHSPRRLSAEEMRDAILLAAGTLTPDRPAGSQVQILKMIEMRDNGPEAKSIHQRADASTNRSVYLPLLRGVVPRSLEAFDPVEQTLVTGIRESTTVPSQALYLLNSTFVRQQSLALFEKNLAEAGTNDEQNIRNVYQRVVGRRPTPSEIENAQAFLTDYAASVPESELAALKVELAGKTGEQAPNSPESQPANPDDVDQTSELVVEEAILARDARSAAWLALVQALFGSAEFRYIR